MILYKKFINITSPNEKEVNQDIPFLNSSKPYIINKRAQIINSDFDMENKIV